MTTNLISEIDFDTYELCDFGSCKYYVINQVYNLFIREYNKCDQTNSIFTNINSVLEQFNIYNELIQIKSPKVELDMQLVTLKHKSYDLWTAIPYISKKVFKFDGDLSNTDCDVVCGILAGILKVTNLVKSHNSFSNFDT